MPAGIAAAADDPQRAGVDAGQMLGRHAVRRAGADRMQKEIRYDGRHPHVRPVKQADDLRPVRPPIARIDPHGGRAEPRHHGRQDTDVVPKMPGMGWMRHRVSLQMVRGPCRLLFEHALDDVDGFPVGIAARQCVFHILLGQKKHRSTFCLRL